MNSGKGERYGPHGRRIEDVEIFVNVIGKSVYMHIESPKKTQMFMMTLDEWRKATEVVERKAGGE